MVIDNTPEEITARLLLRVDRDMFRNNAKVAVYNGIGELQIVIAYTSK